MRALELEELEQIAAAATRATAELYRRIAGWEPEYRTAYGRPLFLNHLLPFPRIAGAPEIEEWLVEAGEAAGRATSRRSPAPAPPRSGPGSPPGPRCSARCARRWRDERGGRALQPRTAVRAARDRRRRRHRARDESGTAVHAGADPPRLLRPARRGQPRRPRRRGDRRLRLDRRGARPDRPGDRLRPRRPGRAGDHRQPAAGAGAVLLFSSGYAEVGGDGWSASSAWSSSPASTGCGCSGPTASASSTSAATPRRWPPASPSAPRSSPARWRS